ncbi:MAG TPA: diacylglycerol kinase family protein [Candidatus Eisenbacteria bacterium]|jgi:YegS/Rv2252/BmrU family lipid kinase|nr:diacylglycerol kinase family protein [Candidatus Eisenbacteria bacterium]
MVASPLTLPPTTLPEDRFFAIVNPAAGGGKSSKLAGAMLNRLRESRLHIDIIASASPGHAGDLAHEAYAQGYRNFLAVGGDGTAHEILNGVFSRNASPDRIALGLLPLGTGNSFLRDFTDRGSEASIQALLENRKRPVDLIRLTHSTGEVYSFNILSLGFTADVGAIANRLFKPLGHLGYLLGILVRIIQLKRRAFTLRCDSETVWDDRRSLFLTFNNSKYTGGTMLIAPQADPSDGFIEFVRWGPIGRLGLLRMLPRLYNGTHVEHPLASRKSVRHVEFNIPIPVDVMIDGEILRLKCKSLDILPSALDVFI